MLSGVIHKHPASDGRMIECLQKTPASDAVDATLIYVHSKGGNFYTGPGWFIPQADTADRFAHIGLNMRCHDLAYSRGDSSYVDFEAGGGYIAVDGGYWEDLEVGHLDVQVAVDLARELNPNAPIYLVGHSSGGFYIADYAARHPGEVGGLVFLSPVLSHRRVIDQWFPTVSERAEIAARCQALCDDGTGGQLISVRQWFYAISARSLLQRLDEPDAPLEDRLAVAVEPRVFIWGGGETRADAWRNVARRTKSDAVSVRDLDHNYLGGEAEVGSAVLDWVSCQVESRRGVDHAGNVPADGQEAQR